MLRRTFLCTLPLIAALFAAPANASPAAGVPVATTRSSVPKIVESGYKVEYRRPGLPGWVFLGDFKGLDPASAAAKNLYVEGHEVRVTKFESVTLLRPDGGRTTTTTTMPKVRLRLPTGVSIVSWTRAVQVFAAMRGHTEIAFRYPLDGCYARAHLMGKLMQAMGLNPGKAWAFDDRAMDDKKASPRMYARTGNHPKGEVWWKYHVAPMLGVRDAEGKVRMHVIDPSLFPEPVTLAKWQGRMVHPSIRFAARLDVTAWDQAPMRSNGVRFAGRGYWPGADPASNLDAAAKVTMAKYKPLQGTNRVPVEPKRPASTLVAKKPSSVSYTGMIGPGSPFVAYPPRTTAQRAGTTWRRASSASCSAQQSV